MSATDLFRINYGVSDAVIVALIAAVPSTLFGIIGLRERRSLKKDINLVSVQVDGRLTEFLELTKKASHAEGVKDEKESHP